MPRLRRQCTTALPDSLLLHGDMLCLPVTEFRQDLLHHRTNPTGLDHTLHCTRRNELLDVKDVVEYIKLQEASAHSMDAVPSLITVRIIRCWPLSQLPCHAHRATRENGKICGARRRQMYAGLYAIDGACA